MVRCWHIEQALSAVEMAPKTVISLSGCDGLPKELIDVLRLASVDEKLEVFSLPGGNVAVPLLDETTDVPAFTHVMNDKVLRTTSMTSLKT